MFSFKAYLTRYLAVVSQLVPSTKDSITRVLAASATAAAQQCSGGPNGRMCGLSWSKKSQWDGTSGVGQQMAALEVIGSQLIKHSQTPLTGVTGGTSQGDAAAGIVNAPDVNGITPATAGGRAGAGILTTLILALWICFCGAIVWER
jgi:mannan endo-1,6-alpha-mannosidase